MRRGGKTSLVAVTRVGNDVPAAVREAMEQARFRDYVPDQGRVVVKPNLGWDLFIPGSVTSPLVLRGVLEVLAERAAALSVVEADQVLEDVQSVFERGGYREVAREVGAEFVNMSRAGRRSRKAEGMRVLHEVEFPEILTDACLVTVPVMKTHNKTGLSGAIKNQWGCLPETRHNYHLVLDEALLDMLELTRPAFAVMDATVGLEGNGPKTGRPRQMDLVLASGDPVALDAVQAYLMGLEPACVRHVVLAGEAGLGEHRLDRIAIAGPELDSLRCSFRPAGHNMVSRVEMLLRRSFLRPLAFHTPLFDLLCLGAKLWYRAWSLMGHRGRIWRDALEHPVYGSQWPEELRKS